MRLPSAFVLLLPFTIVAQTPVVLLTPAVDLAASVRELDVLRSDGLHVSVIAAPGTYIGSVPEGMEGALNNLRHRGRVIAGVAGEDAIAALPEHQRIGVRYLNALISGRFDDDGTRAQMDWSAHANDALDHADGGSGGTQDDNDRTGTPDAPDWTCGTSYNSEVMSGTVCASAFFIESNGSIDANTYTWTAADITSTELQLIDAWSIWSYTASLYGQTVTAVMDFYEPSGGIPVQGYEPVTHGGGSDYLWIQAIMTNAGRTESGSFAMCNGFNHDRRNALGTDHAYCAFIAYNPPAQSAPTQFTDGYIGYAYLGGPYTQLLFKANGWGTNQINRVYGHETGHIFHNFDEYTASGSGNCTRYFNGRQNANYQASPCNGAAACVMIDNSFTGSGSTRHWNLCTNSPYHLGWSGTLTPPVCGSPINDAVITNNPFTLHWNRSGAPATASGYVKVFDRVTENTVYCGYVGANDSLVLSLVNGQYRWTISQGNTNSSNGYAGIISTSAQFTVNAPLHAAFSTSAGTICAGATVVFTDQSTGAPTSWNWTFTGGSPSSYTGKVPPAITYATAGTYAVSLLVGDGLTTNTATVGSAITVTGGAALPFTENFNGGMFPPGGWTSYGSEGQSPLAWSSDPVSGCSQQNAALVNAYPFTGFGSPQIGTPRIDLTVAAIPYLRFKYSYAQETSANTETFQVYGNNCAYSIYSTFFNRTGAALTTNGGAYVAGVPWQPTQCSDWREVLLKIDQLSGQIAQLWFYLNTQGGQNFFLDDISVFNGCRLNLRVMLQGPYDQLSFMMADSLRTRNMLPLTEPYTALAYSFKGEGGGEAIGASVLNVAGGNAIVDWLIIEVRDATDPTKIITSRAALLQRDGDVVDLDGISAPRVGVPAGNYHICVKHRNHLGVMTAAPMAVSINTPLLDFSDPVTATWGSGARLVIGARAVLWSSEVNGDGDVKYTGLNNDRDPILVRIGGIIPTNTVNGYWNEDGNLDGTVKYTGLNNDRDPILFNIGGTLPNQVRHAQVP